MATSSITLVFQFGTSVEIFAIAALFGFVALTLSYLLRPLDRVRLTRWRLGSPGHTCYVLSLFLHICTTWQRSGPRFRHRSNLQTFMWRIY